MQEWWQREGHVSRRATGTRVYVSDKPTAPPCARLRAFTAATAGASAAAAFALDTANYAEMDPLHYFDVNFEKR